MSKTLVKVKRRIEDDPLDAFILNCKIRRINEDDENNPAADADGAAAAAATTTTADASVNQSSTILKYAATCDELESVFNKVKNLEHKRNAEEIVSKNWKPSMTMNRRIDDRKKTAKEDRFKIINCYRHMENETNDDENIITIVEVIKEEPVATNESDTKQSKSDFVYDLYLTTDNNMPTNENLNINDLISINAFDDVMYDTYRDDGYNYSDNESEDSNDENNWRNDYPDEDYDDWGDNIDGGNNDYDDDDDDDDDDDSDNYDDDSDSISLDEDHLHRALNLAVHRNDLSYDIDDIEYNVVDEVNIVHDDNNRHFHNGRADDDDVNIVRDNYKTVDNYLERLEDKYDEEHLSDRYPVQNMECGSSFPFQKFDK